MTKSQQIAAKRPPSISGTFYNYLLRVCSSHRVKTASLTLQQCLQLEIQLQKKGKLATPF